MKQFRGTKGKWYAEIHPAEHCSVLSEINQGGTIAEVSDGTYWGCDNGFEVSKANAQLIAAAPELLRVVQAMQLSMMAHPDYQYGRNQEFVDYVDIAEDVIKKALGE